MHNLVPSSYTTGREHEFPSLALPSTETVSIAKIREIRPLSNIQSRVNHIYQGVYEGLPVIIKISNPTWGEEKVVNESSALTFVATSTNVPVPRVLGTGTTSPHFFDDRQERNYLILSMLPGVPWSSCNLDENAHRYALEQMGRFIHELRKHDCSTPGNFITHTRNEHVIRSTFEIPGVPDAQLGSFADYLFFFVVPT